jgi:hypothetical protein
MTLPWVTAELQDRISATARKSVSDLAAAILERRDDNPIATCKWLHLEFGLSYADAKALVAIACDDAKSMTGSSPYVRKV